MWTMADNNFFCVQGREPACQKKVRRNYERNATFRHYFLRATMFQTCIFARKNAYLKLSDKNCH